MTYKDEYEVARLHPPLLPALGLRRKLRLGRWITPALHLLRAGRRLRGTLFDPFGRAELPDVVRRYEDIKLANVATFRRRATELLIALEAAAG
jgi:indolepyruvate ferredoxin oxidoreductase